MNRMNILFVNSIRMFGGGEIWMLITLEGLRDRGHDVGLVCRPDTELERRAAGRGITVHPLKIMGDFNPVSILMTRQIIRKNHYTIVLTNMDRELRFAGLAARMAGGTAVFPRRGIDYPLKNRWQYRFAYNRLAHTIVANSEATRQALLRNAPWLDGSRIRVIYNGIDPRRYQTPPDKNLRQALGIPDDVPVAGFVGQLDERKGIHALMGAFEKVHARFPRAVLMLTGEGPMAHDIAAWSGEKGLDNVVRMTGFRKDIPEIMKILDFLVLPSLWEGFGIVLIEAMAAGRACITTNVSSMPEIVLDNETGIVVPADDEDALAHAMIRLLDNPDMRMRYGENGRRRVEDRFTLSRMVGEYEALFASV